MFSSNFLRFQTLFLFAFYRNTTCLLTLLAPDNSARKTPKMVDFGQNQNSELLGSFYYSRLLREAIECRLCILKGFIWTMSGRSDWLRLQDIIKSKSLNKLLIRAFGVAHFGSNFLYQYQTNSNLDFRSLISIIFTSFECILAPLYENRYFQSMFTVQEPKISVTFVGKCF